MGAGVKECGSTGRRQEQHEVGAALGKRHEGTGRREGEQKRAEKRPQRAQKRHKRGCRMGERVRNSE